MAVVVDASVLVAATADAGPEGWWAEEIAFGPLLAPHLVLVEATNVLRRLELAGHLSHLEAAAAARDLLDFDLELVPFHPFADRVWELRRNVTSYDGWYVAVAEELDLALATLDRHLAASVGPRCRFLLPPTDLDEPSP